MNRVGTLSSRMVLRRGNGYACTGSKQLWPTIASLGFSQKVRSECRDGSAVKALLSEPWQFQLIDMRQ